jgi:hypothetical protein
MPIFRTLPRAFAALALIATLPWAAEASEFGRVGRIVEMQGDVSFFDPDREEWTEALRNRPITTGDRLVLARGARAELRVGGAVLLLASGADVEVLELDDEHLRLELHRGAMALRLASRDIAEQTEIRTRETRLRPQRAGQYRIDRDDQSTFAAVMRGSLEASGHGHLLLIDAGERHEIWLDERRDSARSRSARWPDDRLADWADEAFRAEDRRSESARYASPDIPGIEDLDRHGRWDSHPEYGAVWRPIGVSANWQPFRDGRWVWMRPWGWTWVDARPWGFAPSHYGRWVQWGVRWVWWPGVRHARPVFSPAVVAWVGGPQIGVSIHIGHGPPASWVPLRPYQPYVPIVVPRPYPPYHGQRPPPPKYYPPQVPTGPISRPPPQQASAGRPAPPAYGSQGVPVGVQAVTSARPAPMARPAAPMAAVAPVAPTVTAPRPAPAAIAVPPLRPSPAPFSAPPAPRQERTDSRNDQRRRNQTQ